MNKQIVLNEQLVSYSQFGNQNAQGTLIFLHGWRSNKEVWFQIVNQISRSANYQIYTIDLPGFGASPVPKADWGVGDYANLVAEFITKLDLKNVIIVGHSFGGRVGIKLTSVRADLVKRLILVDAAGFVMHSNKKSAMGLAAKIVRPLFKPKFMQGLRKKIYKQIGAEDYIATPSLQKIFVKTVNEDLTENMKRILQPTLIIWGENDFDVSVESGKKMSALIPNSKFIILPQSGHFSFLDKPEEFVKNLNEFI